MYRTRVQSRGAGKPTRDDVARRANISGATVSRVLSGRDDIAISPDTRERVLAAARELGYQPNASARALTSGRTGLVGFWMSLAYSPYRGRVLNEMRSVLGTTEMALAVTDVDEEYQWDHNFARALRVPVDGIIAFDNSASIEAFGAQRDRLAPGTPFVSMGAYWSEAQSFVGIDLRAGADAAMTHLLETGRRRIAYLAPWTSDLLDAGPRYEAFRAAMDAAGYEPRTIGVERDDHASVHAALTPLATSGDLPDAVLCMNDSLALAASSVLQNHGVRPGHDIALVGFDGLEETAYAPCPLTTVRQPIEEMCALAVAFLTRQIGDPDAPLQQCVLTPQLIVRESTQW